MKVWSQQIDESYEVRQREDLELLLAQPSDAQVRPCPECNDPCPCSGSRTCSCACSPACDRCPMYMSSDPERYPIEPKIVPLVYAMHASRVCPPCWSCEGHMGSDRETVAKLPRVWFYARSAIYPRLIAEHLDDLTFQKKLKNPWTVRVLSWSSGLSTRFSIEPGMTPGVGVNLTQLQFEAKTIAEQLNQVLHQKARNYLTALKS